jgi:hypothetical protein
VIPEIGYAVDTLKMDGVTTTTSINDTYLGEPQFDLWLDELNGAAQYFSSNPISVIRGQNFRLRRSRAG